MRTLIIHCQFKLHFSAIDSNDEQLQIIETIKSEIALMHMTSINFNHTPNVYTPRDLFRSDSGQSVK